MKIELQILSYLDRYLDLKVLMILIHRTLIRTRHFRPKRLDSNSYNWLKYFTTPYLLYYDFWDEVDLIKWQYFAPNLLLLCILLIGRQGVFRLIGSSSGVCLRYSHFQCTIYRSNWNLMGKSFDKTTEEVI